MGPIDGSEIEEEDYFFISNGVSYLALRLRDIVRLKVGQNFTTIKVGEKSFRIRKTLDQCRLRLNRHFFLANRFEVINLAHIKSIEAFDERRLIVKMSDGESVLFSRTQSVLFRKERSF